MLLTHSEYFYYTSNNCFKGWRIIVGDRDIRPGKFHPSCFPPATFPHEKNAWKQRCLVLRKIYRWREPVLTSVLNLNASEANYKPEQCRGRNIPGCNVLGGIFRERSIPTTSYLSVISEAAAIRQLVLGGPRNWELAWTASFSFPSNPFHNYSLPSLPYFTHPPLHLTPSSRDFITKCNCRNKPSFSLLLISFTLFTFPNASCWIFLL